VNGYAAIEVPSTGIVGSEELTKAYARIAKDRGANIVTNAAVERLEPTREGIRVVSAAGEIETRCLVNSAGLFADEIAAMLGSPMAAHKIYPVRGEYCELVRSKQHLICGPVYPLPHPEGVSLGVHFTKTVWGNVLLGPTAKYLDDKNNYERDRQSVEQFARGAKLLLPNRAFRSGPRVLRHSRQVNATSQARRKAGGGLHHSAGSGISASCSTDRH